jgi:hypothetical protein
MQTHPILSLIALCALATAPQGGAFEAFLDGTSLPEAPWQSFLDGEEDQRGETLTVDFLDPVGQTNNQALRLNSGTGANELTFRMCERGDFELFSEQIRRF